MKENKVSHSNRQKNCDGCKNRQSFPIHQSPQVSTTSSSPISGGSANLNFPSSVGTGNQPTTFRIFNKEEIRNFCGYDPERDFERCLRAHEDAVPSNWTRAQAERIRITPDNVTTEINEPFPRISPDLWIWDMWPLTEKDGSTAVLPGGWRVLFALTAPKSVLPGKRHDVARIGYFYSKNGNDWIQGGTVFPEGDALGSRQWAGSAFVEDDTINFFYTATGRRGESQVTYEQRIALARGRVISDLNGVLFDDWAPHQVILEPDGVLYQTLEQSLSGGIIYAFRDPFFFKDPASGCEYLLFEGNIGGVAGEFDCGPGVPPEARFYTGNIGIALLRNEDFTEWELLPALLQAPCTNQQTERPHLIVNGGRYYLFTDSHQFTFAPGLVPGPGPDGLYGFVAGSLRGNYTPLNGGGLVVTNAPQEPFQAYSWLVLPDFTVLSFIDNFNLQGISIEEVGLLPDEFQFAHFGGTLAPTLQLKIFPNNTTKIVNELGYGVLTLSQTESPKCNQQFCNECDDVCLLCSDDSKRNKSADKKEQHRRSQKKHERTHGNKQENKSKKDRDSKQKNVQKKCSSCV
ncbi:glycoside hydrolase family 68 protein [Sporolactobacillus kofuensis]|uniref:Glycoside hydrolase family 68 protein n=1 Tax=Sporolactobacillus kofuensis TaxID=269672 RepID=A0ABW1WFT5_9BACL|nr:glycoside hydrolase family 68 protein [Sporolactobacillus kofuensis]MCO7175216.1 glycoside hydrolase family 68 protein [Sporolactobacillus kofuensis]